MRKGFSSLPSQRSRTERADASRIPSLLADANGQAPSNNLTDWDHIEPLANDMNIAFERLDKQLDKRHIGVITNQQLADLLENSNLKGADAATAAALYKINQELQHGDIKIPMPANPQGLSSQELEQVIYKAEHARTDKLPPSDQSWDNVTAPELWAQTQFVLTHKDQKTGKITVPDIDKAIATTIGDTETKKSLNFFKQHYAEIAADGQRDANDGVTYQDLQNFARKYSSADDAFNALRNVIYFHSQVVNEKTPPNLYVTLDPEQSVSHLGIEQGPEGDCYFEAPLASTADSHRSSIPKMIQANTDGTFTVTFSGQSYGYTVTKPTEAEHTLYNHGAIVGDWATTIEKAYGLYTNDASHHGLVQKKGEVPEEYSNHPGQANEALSTLTNKNVQSISMVAAGTNYVKEHLIAAEREGRAVVVDRQPENFANDELVDLPMAHAYSVLHYDPSGPDGGTVTCRNPAGLADDTYSGIFKMPLNQFVKSFESIFEEPSAVPTALANPFSFFDPKLGVEQSLNRPFRLDSDSKDSLNRTFTFNPLGVEHILGPSHTQYDFNLNVPLHYDSPGK
jgi:Calpain family cysteine protease